MIHKLGLDKLLFGKRHHQRELALALVAGRVIEPGSKLSLAQALAPGAEHHSLGEVLGMGELGKAIDPANPESFQEKRAADEFYAAMDWLLERQASVEELEARFPGLLPDILKAAIDECQLSQVSASGVKSLNSSVRP